MRTLHGVVLSSFILWLTGCGDDSSESESTHSFRAAAIAESSTALVNPGFESSGNAGVPSGWSEGGLVSASYVEAGGHTGAFRLTHYAPTSYDVSTTQRVTGLASGTYTFRAWVRSSGDQRAVHLSLVDCGGPVASVAVPHTGDEWWTQVTLGTRVTGGKCTVVVHSEGNPGSWLNVDDLELVQTPPTPRMKVRGADVSQLLKNEHFGAIYRDEHGRARDALDLLGAAGVNYVRLKVWVDPADGFNDVGDVLVMARRAHARGLKLLIDFHYSDTWADPGQQRKPAAWAALSVDQLVERVHDHTFDVLAALRAQGTPADMAQLGNEINGGMLWPDGRSDRWDDLATFLAAAADGARAASPSTRIVLHLAEGGNNAAHRWWFDSAVARGVPFDIIAVSHYLYWHGPLGYLQANLVDLASRYHKDVMVVETAYGFTTAEHDAETNVFTAALASAGGYPATPSGQAQALRDMFEVVRAVPEGRGLGVFYWEPTWTAVAGAGWDPTNPYSGDGWENQALFDYADKALPALRVFGQL